MLVLRDAAVSGLSGAEQVLDDMKGVFNFRPHAGLEPFSVLNQGLLLALRHFLHLPTFSGRFAAPT